MDIKDKDSLLERLSALLPELEFSKETHRQWRDCEQIYRDQNPMIGDPAFHDTQVELYEERIETILDTISLLKYLP